MPTGVRLHDARRQLFEAAERVLLRDGPSALTSRSVTAEAGVAKGVLHRHFVDFDAFLAELVFDRVDQIGRQATALQDAAGTGRVVDNLVGALSDLFGSVALEMIGLLISRQVLLSRLRQLGASRLPVIWEGTTMIASYLEAERDLGRVAAHADVAMLGPALIGAGHMAFAGRRGIPPPPGEVTRVVKTVIDAVVQPA